MPHVFFTICSSSYLSRHIATPYNTTLYGTWYGAFQFQINCLRSTFKCAANPYPWEWSCKPWQRIHIHFAGPMLDKLDLSYSAYAHQDFEINMADLQWRIKYTRKAKENTFSYQELEKKADQLVKEDRKGVTNSNRTCLPGLYLVERIISSWGSGEVFYIFCRLMVIIIYYSLCKTFSSKII